MDSLDDAPASASSEVLPVDSKAMNEAERERERERAEYDEMFDKWFGRTGQKLEFRYRGKLTDMRVVYPKARLSNSVDETLIKPGLVYQTIKNSSFEIIEAKRDGFDALFEETGLLAKSRSVLSCPGITESALRKRGRALMEAWHSRLRDCELDGGFERKQVIRPFEEVDRQNNVGVAIRRFVDEEIAHIFDALESSKSPSASAIKSAIDAIVLELEDPELLSLIFVGSTGAGKSFTINMLLQLSEQPYSEYGLQRKTEALLEGTYDAVFHGINDSSDQANVSLTFKT